MNDINNSLSQFNNILSKNSSEAKNFLSFLLGYMKNLYPVNEDYAQAFLNVYNNFSEEIKKDEKAFSQVFHKFFLFFKLNDTNKKYYEQFEGYWSDTMRDEVRRLNPDYAWSKPVYKNILQLTRVLNEYFYKQDVEKIKKIINDSHSEITRLTKTAGDKNKFIEHLHKNNGWAYFIKCDFEAFQDFCKTYSIDPNKILHKVIQDKNDGLQFIYSSHDQQQRNLVKVLSHLLMDDLYKVFGNGSFLDSSNQKSRYSYNILDIFLLLVGSQQYNIATELVEKYSGEMKQSLRKYLYHDNKGIYRTELESLDYFITRNINAIDLLCSKTWMIVLHNLHQNCKSYSSQEPLNEILVKNLLDNVNIPEVIEKHSLKNKLETETSNVNLKTKNVHKI